MKYCVRRVLRILLSSCLVAIASSIIVCAFNFSILNTKTTNTEALMASMLAIAIYNTRRLWKSRR